MPNTDKQLLLNKLSSAINSITDDSQFNSIMQLITSEINNCDISYPQYKAKVNSYLQSEELIKAFIFAKQIGGRSAKTIDRYKYCINKLIEASNTQITQITVYHIRDYLLKEKNRGIADCTIKGYRNIFSSFFGWLHREGLINTNPTTNINTIK